MLGKWKTTAEEIAAILKTLALVIAPLVFYFEYWSKVEAERSARALAAIKEFRASPEFKQVENRGVRLVETGLFKSFREAGMVSAQQKSLCPYHGFMSAGTNSGLAGKADLIRILARFDEVAICANSGVCRRQELCAAFYVPMQELASDLCTIIEDIEHFWNRSLTDQLVRFMKSCKRDYLTFCDELARRAGKSKPQLMDACYTR